MWGIGLASVVLALLLVKKLAASKSARAFIGEHWGTGLGLSLLGALFGLGHWLMR
jgi:hypothetical protein